MMSRIWVAAALVLSLGLSPLALLPAKAATETEKSQTTKKPKRERSAAQKKNDQIMRDCGAEWREKKDSLSKKGTKWRDFLKDCRAKKKS